MEGKQGEEQKGKGGILRESDAPEEKTFQKYHDLTEEKK